ncbi:MAG: hypothetical protein LBT57_02315 [Puniceicoccales bacterium]|nr:hypothetical protein [Puniceicoccales bacterium]
MILLTAGTVAIGGRCRRRRS